MKKSFKSFNWFVQWGDGSKENGAVYIGAILRHGSISIRTDVAENTEYASQPFFQTATQFLETADFRPQDEKYPVVSASIQQMAESVVSGKSPEDAIKQ